MTTFRFAYFALLAACTTPAPQSPHDTAPLPPAKLGPKLARADFDARLADHRLHEVDVERLSDDTTAATSSAPAVRVDGDVLAALACRGGQVPSLVSDDHYVYVVFDKTSIMMPDPPDGPSMPGPSMPIPTLAYCSFQRFRIPATLAYGGQLSLI